MSLKDDLTGIESKADSWMIANAHKILVATAAVVFVVGIAFIVWI